LNTIGHSASAEVAMHRRLTARGVDLLLAIIGEIYQFGNELPDLGGTLTPITGVHNRCTPRPGRRRHACRRDTM